MDTVNDTNFEEKVLQSDALTIVDFWAEWCPPCRAFGPIFEDVSNDNKDAHFYKCNVDESGAAAQQFGVRSIPTTIFFKGGKEIDRVTGAMNKEQFEAKVAEHK